MKSNIRTFVIVVVIVLGLSGGAFILGKRTDNKTNNSTGTDTSNSDSVDSGNVNGTNTEDGASVEYKEKLAKFLTAQGAVMYGAYWCPHCKDQKALFGNALKFVNYVECDAAGENANPDECQAKDIKSYPTWSYQGKLYPGLKSLSDLAAMVGFTDSTTTDSVAQ